MHKYHAKTQVLTMEPWFSTVIFRPELGADLSTKYSGEIGHKQC